ncbi:DUF4349 domain-containing protein [Candidatus Microgenomates bacterium]|nr:DUF4349 domain-containing protein [Candidatus Microgenomates bacterium]
MVIFTWIKRNKLAAILLIIVAYFLFRGIISSFFGITLTSTSVKPFSTPDEFSSLQRVSAPSTSFGLPIGSGSSIYSPAAPAPEVKDRLVVEESHASLLVKNVAQTLDLIKGKATSLGGYMVESSLDRPDEATSGQITIRIPNNTLDESLNYFRSLAVKVVSENLRGTDVTDEYVDIDARLKTLEKNKERFEEIMDQAVKIEDILRIQQEILSIQSQIDSLRGQQNYLEKTAQMSKITIFLSTDELSLPYAPEQPWRPQVVFKYAVRSMLGNLQNIGSLIIWLIVYAVIWLPIILIILYARSRLKKSPYTS